MATVLLTLVCISAFMVHATSARALYSKPLTASDICNGNVPTSQVAKTVTDLLLQQPNGLTAAEARAFVDAGNQCCPKLKAVMAQAASAASAAQNLKLADAAATASSVAGFRGCTLQEFASVQTYTSVTKDNIQATVNTQQSGNTPAMSASSVSLAFGPGGTVTTQAAGAAGGFP